MPGAQQPQAYGNDGIVTPSSNLSTSPQSTIASFTTYISSSPLSPLNPITSHCPLRHIPAVTDFGLVVSRTPIYRKVVVCTGSSL